MPFVGPSLDKPVNLSDVLRRGLETKPDEDALVSLRRRWTWRMLDSASSRLACGYLDLELRPGDRIASLMPNRTELLVHYIACKKSGLVAVPLNYRYMAPEIDHALEVCGARILLAHDERLADLEASRLAGGLPLGRIDYGDGGESDGTDFESLMEAPHRDFAPPEPEDPAIIFLHRAAPASQRVCVTVSIHSAGLPPAP